MTVKRSKEALMSMALACRSLFMKSTKGSCITPQALLQRETALDSSSAMERQQAHSANQWQLEHIKHGSSTVVQSSSHLLDSCLACNLAIQQYTMQQPQVGTVLWDLFTFMHSVGTVLRDLFTSMHSVGLYHGIFSHLCFQSDRLA